MTNEAQEPLEEFEQAPYEGGGSGVPLWLIVAITVLAVGVGYLIYGQYQVRATISGQLEVAGTKLTRLDARAATLEDNYATLKALSDETLGKQKLTGTQLARVRKAAERIKKEQQEVAQRLAAQLEEQQSQLGSLTGEVTGVKETVEETRQSLEATMLKVERTIGDLGVQSGLIASNGQELQELRARGERDYFDFDLQKSRRYTRVGDISIRLAKSDVKRQKFTLNVLLNDKRIEKKDKTLLEPVQFYIQGTRHLLEVVVFEVEKNRIKGYLSVPKEVAMASSGG